VTSHNKHSINNSTMAAENVLFVYACTLLFALSFVVLICVSYNQCSYHHITVAIQLLHEAYIAVQAALIVVVQLYAAVLQLCQLVAVL
jgi:hypothetical protein